jgi:hypothetical protein
MGGPTSLAINGYEVRGSPIEPVIIMSSRLAFRIVVRAVYLLPAAGGKETET